MESLANIYAGMDPSQSECCLITPTEVLYEPSYGGYGKFAGIPKTPRLYRGVFLWYKARED